MLSARVLNVMVAERYCDMVVVLCLFYICFGASHQGLRPGDQRVSGALLSGFDDVDVDLNSA